MLTINKTHKKTYVHKKFKNNNQSNKLFFTEIKMKMILNQNLNKKDEYNKELKKEETIYEKPIKQELFKHNTINNIKNHIDESENTKWTK